MSTNEQILDRLENKLDVALLVIGGMSREEAEQKVYLPKLAKLASELEAAVQRLHDVVEGYGR